jgi:uncharacterized membrane protein
LAELSGKGSGAEYRARLAHHQSLRDEAARRSVRLSNVRAATFVAVLASWIAFEEMQLPSAWVGLAAAVLLSIAFVAQVALHRKVRRTERREGVLASVAREGLLRLDRDWAALEEVLVT